MTSRLDQRTSRRRPTRRNSLRATCRLTNEVAALMRNLPPEYQWIGTQIWTAFDALRRAEDSMRSVDDNLKGGRNDSSDRKAHG